MSKLLKNNPFSLTLFIYGLFAINLWLICLYAPQEKVQGLVQKIFYFHVSSAFAMYFAFAISGIGAISYLIKKTPFWNAVCQAGTSVGLLFCTMVLISGPLWAKPIWGAWWTWDPRLTTTLILWLIFFATVLLRKSYGLDPKGQVYAAILTLFGILDIPLIIFAVKIWRGIHPAVLGKDNNMPFEMKLTLIVSMISILLLMALFIWLHTRHLLITNRFYSYKEQLSERNH
jgi:heme exporter protein C